MRQRILGIVSLALPHLGEDNMTMSDRLKSGTTVKLKSGGSNMTVINAIPFANGKGLRGYQCEFIDNNKKIRKVYPPDILIVISEPRAI